MNNQQAAMMILSQLQILSIVLLVLNQHIVSHATAVSPTIITLLSELPFNEDNRLSKHIFAYPAGKCASLINTDDSIFDGQWGHTFMALDGDAYRAVFGHLDGIDVTNGVPSDDTVQTFHDCTAACLEKGTHKDVVARPLPHRYWNKGTKDDEGIIEEVDNVNDFLRSDSCGKVEYGFINYHENTLKLFWINENTGEKIFNQDLGFGERETSFITTFIGHKFQFYDSLPNEDDPTQNELMYELLVENHGVVGIKNHKQPHVRENVKQEVEETLQKEWQRHLNVKRTFSPIGFDKGRLPDDVFASLGAYYYNNRNSPNKVHEEWGSHKGPYVNYWETDVNFIQIPWHLKSRWQGRLLKLVEAWTGVELDITDMYGMREYTQGARLLTHVDRESTHAASLIVNIAQENVSKPWTVEVSYIWCVYVLRL